MNRIAITFDCPFSPWIVGIAGLMVLGVVVFFVRRDVKALRRGLRVGILALVVTAGLMLIGFLLGPKINLSWPDPRKPRAVVLVDGTRSMLLTDTYSGPAADWLRGRRNEPGAGELQMGRQDVARLLLSGDPQGLKALLSDKFDVAAMRFASGIEKLPEPFEADTDAYSTDLGEALKGVGFPSGATSPAAVVLVSDGVWNRGSDPTEVARLLGRSGIPVYVLGVGDPNPPVDAAIVGVRAPKTALRGDEVFVTAQVAATGMKPQPLAVELSGTGIATVRETITTLPSGRPVNVNFSFIPEEPGKFTYAVRIAAQTGEKNLANNEASFPLEVIDRRIKCLMIENEPRWDFRFLRNVLERDQAVTLSVCLLRPGVGPLAGEGYATALPADKKALGPYDLVILGDVPVTALPPNFCADLVDMVKQRSGALIIMAGRRNHYRELASTPLSQILPVSLEGMLPPDLPGAQRFKAELTQDGATHLLTRLSGDPEQNEQIWDNLPPLRWAAGVAGLTRGATALLVHPYRLAGSAKLPLVAVQRVGGGKVLFIGIEELWRWRQRVGDKYHYRLCAQMVRWMIKKQFADGDSRARLSLSQSECDVGEPVEVEAYCLNPEGYPLESGEVSIIATHQDGRTQKIDMQAAPGGWGIYRATFAPARPGKYEIRPVVSTYGNEALTSVATLEASRVDLEKNFLAQNIEALRGIAEASGGKYINLKDVSAIPAELGPKAERRTLTAEYSPYRRWAWVYFPVMALLLAANWLIRKRSGLA